MHEQSITDIRATQCSGHISCTEVTGRWGLVSRARDADSSMHSIYKNILIFFGGFVQTFSCTHERDLNTAEKQLQREDGWGGGEREGGERQLTTDSFIWVILDWFRFRNSILWNGCVGRRERNVSEGMQEELSWGMRFSYIASAHWVHEE